MIAHIARSERTCGGLPRMLPPNNVTFAKDCSDCDSGKPCNTCADKNLAKCRHFDMAYLLGGRKWNPQLDAVRYAAGLEGFYPEHCSNGLKDDGSSEGFNFQLDPDEPPEYRDLGETAVDEGGPCWPAMPKGACRCCANISYSCTRDLDCAQFWEGGNQHSPCGCSPGAPLMDGVGTAYTAPGTCGPYSTHGTNEEVPVFSNGVRLRGQPCTYTAPDSNICRSAVFAQDGTKLFSRIEDLGVGMDGSKTISVFGPLPDVLRCLEGITYKGDLHYNRLYRIPPELRDPSTFKMESDDLDALEIIVSDNGNSGGMQRDIREDVKAINIRVAAVNDPPEIDAPLYIQAVEDVPYHFEPSKKPPELGGSCEVPLTKGGCPEISCPEDNERFAVYGRLIYGCLPVQILDPDMEDFGFADKKLLLILEARHGSLFLDETFLQEAEKRKNNHPDTPGMCTDCLTNLWAQENCCKCNSALAGCSIEYTANPACPSPPCETENMCDDPGADPRCAMLARGWETRKSGEEWMVERGKRPRGLHRRGSPEFGVGNQYLVIKGTYSDLNAALLGLTYLSNPNFNTRYGIKEEITINVNDLGNMGDNYFQTQHKTASAVIEVEVDSVNDRPQVGRRLLVEDIEPGVLDTDPNRVVESNVIFPFDDTRNQADRCYTLPVTSVDYNLFCSPQPHDMTNRTEIALARYRRYIDIDEDTIFIITPDVLWLDDVDADEALIISDLNAGLTRGLHAAKLSDARFLPLIKEMRSASLPSHRHTSVNRFVHRWCSDSHGAAASRGHRQEVQVHGRKRVPALSGSRVLLRPALRLRRYHL